MSEQRLLAPCAEVRTTLPSSCLLVGIVVSLSCLGAIFYLLHVPATTDHLAPYRRINRLGAPKYAGDVQSWFPPFEDATIFAQEQVNAILYGAGVCVMVSLAVLVYPSFFEPPNRQQLGKRHLAVVILGTTTALLTMRPPTGSPFRASEIISLT